MKKQEVMTSDEAMKYLRVSKKTLLKLVHEGRIKGAKMGRNYRFLKEELDKVLRCESEN